MLTISRSSIPLKIGVTVSQSYGPSATKSYHMLKYENIIQKHGAVERLLAIISAGSSNREYRETSNIRHTLVGNRIVDHSDVVGASPVGAAPTTSSFST